MAKLTTGDVKHVANLAKLNLTEEELKKFVPQLSSIVDYISSLNEVDTQGVEPTSQTTGLTNVFNPDEVSSERVLTQDEALSGTDNIHNGYFKVKAILSERSDK